MAVEREEMLRSPLYRAGLFESLTGTELKELVKATTWMWPGWIAPRHLTVLAGESGIGKSWLAVAIGKAAAHGEPWPDGAPGLGSRAPILWLETEGRHALLLERAERLGMDLDLLRFMPEALYTHYLDDDEYLSDLSGMTCNLEPRLIVVDCWSKSLQGGESSSKVRFCLDELQELARDKDVSILLVHHLRKRQNLETRQSFDFDRLRGSSVLAQIASCVIGVDRPVRTRNCCRVSCGKTNLGAIPKPFGFTITDDGLTFGPAPQPWTHLSRLEEAEAFLRRALAEGPRPAGEVVAEGRGLGIAEETLQRAKRQLCRIDRTGGWHPIWLWSLTEEGHQYDDTVGRVDRVGEQQTPLASLPTPP